MNVEHNIEELISKLVIKGIKENNGFYTVLGMIGNEKALFFIKCNSLTSQDILDILKGHVSKDELVKNDVFSTYKLEAVGSFFLRVIYPADDEKVKKYMHQSRRAFIKETKEMYMHELKKELDTKSHKTNWIRNIIVQEREGTTKEKVYYSDDEILIITNYKWNMQNTDEMYLLVLFKDESLYTVRELKDAEFLKRIKKIVISVVEKEFGLSKEQIYCFFHYPPTYYALHLHIVNANFYGNFCLLGQSILLEDVIANLEADKMHYAKKTICCFKRQSN